MLYAKLTERSWFFVPTIGFVEYEDGERAVAFVWLQLEVGIRWMSYPRA